MVGIARSKACRACRARRKKCDETRPTCGLCAKRGIECVYKKDLNIILVDPGAASVGKERTVSPPTTSSSSPSSSGCETFSLDDLPVSCLNTFNQLQIRANGLSDYLGSDGFVPTSTAWLGAAQELSSPDDVLSDALCALSLSCIGADDFANAQPSRHGQMMYGKTIRRLAISLNRDADALEDSTLATVMVLAAYEAKTATKAGMGAWLTHVKGTSQLVQLRGRRNGATEFAQKLYLGSRLLEFINALGKRKAVENPTRVPPKTLSSSATSYNALFDILMTMPAVLEQGDILTAGLAKQSSAATAADVSVLAYMCQDFQSSLANWYHQLCQNDGEEVAEELFWEQYSLLYLELPEESPSRVMPTYIHFRSPDMGEQLVMYWACLLLLHLFMRGRETAIVQQGLSHSLHPTEAVREAAGIESHDLAKKVTQSLEYFVQPNMGTASVEFLGLPMNVAFGYWSARQAREQYWFPVIFEQLQKINAGTANIVQGMAERGGGGVGFRSLVIKDPKPRMYG